MNRRSNSTSQNFLMKKKFPISRGLLIFSVVIVGLLAGCQTEFFPDAVLQAQAKAREATVPPELVNLREGDEIKISFPGSPTLDATQQIRRDGKISLPLVGEVDAAGLTPSDLQKKLVELYAPQLVSKEVTVELVSSSFPVYVTGMVLHPGKVISDHPLTALEAVMEAGGFDYTTANLKKVTVIRREGNVMKHYTLNLKNALDGKENEPFNLKPEDIIYVPEKFTVF